MNGIIISQPRSVEDDKGRITFDLLIDDLKQEISCISSPFYNQTHTPQIGESVSLVGVWFYDQRGCPLYFIFTYIVQKNNSISSPVAFRCQ
jgi:hypothetical protein